MHVVKIRIEEKGIKKASLPLFFLPHGDNLFW